MILKEWVCAAHGAFEAFVKGDEVAKCPKGCSKRFVKREYRTAPSVRNVVTGTMDSMQRSLAADFGLPDLKVGRDDNKSVMDNLRSGTDFSPKWVDVPKGGVRPSAYGLQGGNSIDSSVLPKSIPTNIVARAKADDIK